MNLPRRALLLSHAHLRRASCIGCCRNAFKAAADPTPLCGPCDDRFCDGLAAEEAADASPYSPEPPGWREPAPEAAPVHACRNCGRSADGLLCGPCDDDYAAYLDENHAAEAMSDALALDACERRGGGW